MIIIIISILSSLYTCDPSRCAVIALNCCLTVPEEQCGAERTRSLQVSAAEKSGSGCGTVMGKHSGEAAGSSQQPASRSRLTSGVKLRSWSTNCPNCISISVNLGSVGGAVLRCRKFEMVLEDGSPEVGVEEPSVNTYVKFQMAYKHVNTCYC